MKKRLRKKTHSGEFTKWGRQLDVVRNRKEGFDEFLDAFVEEAIESSGCCCGGGGKEDKLDVVVEPGRRRRGRPRRTYAQELGPAKAAPLGAVPFASRLC